MLELRINNQALDLPVSGLAIAFKFVNRNSTNLGERGGAGSYTVSLPNTPRNRAILGPLSSTQYTPPVQDFPCAVYDDGREELTGLFRLLQYDRLEIQGQILSGNLDWASQLGAIKLADVDAGQPFGRAFGLPPNDTADRWLYFFSRNSPYETYNHTGLNTLFNLPPGASLDELHEAFQLAHYPFVFYNENDLYGTATLDGLPGGGFPVDALRPATFVLPLLQALYEAAGYRFTSQFLERVHSGEEPGVEPLALPFVRAEWIDFPEDKGYFLRHRLEAETVTANDRTRVLGFQDPPFPTNFRRLEWNRLTADVLGAADMDLQSPSPGRKYRAIVLIPTMRYRLTWDITFTVDTPSAVPQDETISLRQVDVANGINGVELAFFRLEKSDPGPQRWVGEVEIDLRDATPGQWLLQWDMNYNSGPNTAYEVATGSFFQVEERRGLNPVTEGMYYDLRNTLPDMTGTELVTALATVFNGSVDTDTSENVVYFEPQKEFQNQLRRLDLSQVVNRAVDPKYKIDNEFARTAYRLLWKEDGDDLTQREYATAADATATTDVNYAVVPGAGQPYGSFVAPDVSGATVNVQEVEVQSLAASINAEVAPNRLRAILLRDDNFGPLAYRTEWEPRLGMRYVNLSMTVRFAYLGNYPAGFGLPADTTGTGIQQSILQKVPAPQDDPVSLVFDGSFLVGAQTNGGAFLAGSLNFGQVYPETSGPLPAPTTVGLAARYYPELIVRTSGLQTVELELLVRAGIDVTELVRFNRLYIFDGLLLRLIEVDKYTVGKGYTALSLYEIL